MSTPHWTTTYTNYLNIPLICSLMITEEDIKSFLFPYQEAREIQDELIKEVDNCIKNKKNLIVHAPTGLGKSAATLAPALAYALKNKLTVFFLTSRHTQHLIAVDTLKQIKEKHNPNFISVDIIGKKSMCPVPGVNELYSNEFSEFCKHQRDKRLCEFFNNTKKTTGRPTIIAEKTIDDIKKISPCSCEEIMKCCEEPMLCPYETASLLAKEASVIIADYYIIFHPSIRDKFFARAEKSLESSIIIVDEGHNLPKRIREVMAAKVSSIIIERAIKETSKFGYEEAHNYLKSLKEVLEAYHKKLRAVEQKQKETVDEILALKEDFIKKVEEIGKYDEIMAALEFAGDEIREKQKKSYTGSIAMFLEDWLGPDEKFVRIISKKEGHSKDVVSINYRCLDPSIFTKPIINEAHSTIIMSGTLTPTSMYSDLLGFEKENTVEKEYKSPFPEKNKLSLIVPETTTKFTSRNPEQYKSIAEKTASIVNAIPGNTAVFFPSYQLRDDVYRYMQQLCLKTTFLEEPGLTKYQKEELLERFKSYKDCGAVLLGVASGSFGEGIDLPGDFLKAVVVVGLPLQRPDLETKELIDYYDKKFGKGWDYGYVFPAISKCLQSAGRCIRSETDKGIIVFLDQRFAWPNYRKCLPKDVEITKDYLEKINGFFDKSETNK